MRISSLPERSLSQIYGWVPASGWDGSATRTTGTFVCCQICHWAGVGSSMTHMASTEPCFAAAASGSQWCPPAVPIPHPGKAGVVGRRQRFHQQFKQRVRDANADGAGIEIASDLPEFSTAATAATAPAGIGAPVTDQNPSVHVLADTVKQRQPSSCSSWRICTLTADWEYTSSAAAFVMFCSDAACRNVFRFRICADPASRFCISYHTFTENQLYILINIIKIIRFTKLF